MADTAPYIAPANIAITRMDLTMILVAALGLLAVLFLVRGRQQQYASHIQQLQTKTRRTRELTIREWTRAEVALHAIPDDCMLIIRDKADGKLKVRLALL